MRLVTAWVLATGTYSVEHFIAVVCKRVEIAVALVVGANAFDEGANKG